MDTLIRLGHSRIAIIGGDRAISDTSRLRYEGCMQSFTAHGIPFDPKRDYQGVRYSYQVGVSGDQGAAWIRAAGSPRFSPPPT